VLQEEAVMAHTLRTVVLIALLCLLVPAAWADSIVDQFNVNGLLTMYGNNACAPLSACAETLQFSFRIGSEAIPDLPGGSGYWSEVVPGSWTIESLGPLQPFTEVGTGHYPPTVNFVNPGGDDIELELTDPSDSSPTPITPVFDYAYLWGCGTTTCANDFIPPGFGQTIAVFTPAEFELTVTPVPEPQTLSLLFMGLAGLLVLQLWRKFRYASG
jgi:PEP-CTERM motif-containing protein